LEELYLKFVIQEHHATHIHWDFRLEMDGTLKSWAIPKGVSTVVGVKRLAIQVEDHDFSFINFEGTIEEGVYGAGKIMIWDSGAYDLLEKSDKSIEIVLHGKKIDGRYVILYWKEKNWLIFKKT